MDYAPFFDDVAQGPDGGVAYWKTTSDDVRVRLGYWGPETSPKSSGEKGAATSKGTVFIFPGRTEYIEKYGRVAADLCARGYGTFAIDWRGQGLADRLVDDVRIGHVGTFTDYQLDVAEMVKLAGELDLPKPWFLIAHSMGGAIGLRSLMEGLPVQAAAFSAPMWGIGITASVRPAAWALSWGGSKVGLGHKVSPGASLDSYVMVEPFEDNKLTTDADMYKYMQDQTGTYPELGLGGPSLQWVSTSLIETRDLAALPSPSVPTLTFLGSDERIVDTGRVHKRMRQWPSGKLKLIAAAQHEVLMETPVIRAQIFDQSAALFDHHSDDNRQNHG